MSASQTAPVSKVLYVTSEVVPFASTGGLGEVSGSLPPALAGLGVEARVVMPLYDAIDRAAHGLTDTGMAFDLPTLGGPKPARVFVARLGPCPIYFIDSPDYFQRPGLYGTSRGDYGDNAERFSFFCRAVMELAGRLDWQPEVVHCHDWQSALLPVYMKAGLAEAAGLSQAASILTIHNLAYQGVFPRSAFGATGLPEEFNHPRALEYWGKISFLKGGLIAADRLTTVSPGYAEEIMTPEFGMGLDGLLKHRAHDLTGILNGADYSRWDPAVDPLLPANYGPGDLAGKAECRDALLRAFGFEPAGDQTTVLGYVGRLAEQKGVDLFLARLERLLLDDVRLVILGQGDRAIERAVLDAAQAHPQMVGARLEYSDPLAHLVLAGSDILLMPSRFEPCGLNQLHAMRYGAVPVAHATGGLKDTVASFDPVKQLGTGFLFSPAEPAPLMQALSEALWSRARPEMWASLVDQAMAADFSWAASARSYVDLYKNAARG